MWFCALLSRWEKMGPWGVVCLLFSAASLGAAWFVSVTVGELIQQQAHTHQLMKRHF